MKCHGKNNHSPLKHMLHMVLCCGLPLIIIGFLPLISRYTPKLSGTLGLIAPFICPLMMIGMFAMMFLGGKKENCCSNKESEVEETKE